MLPTGSETDIGAALALLAGTVILGIRHGFDWDHIAAITDITSSAVGANPRPHAPATPVAHESMVLATSAQLESGAMLFASTGSQTVGASLRDARLRAFALGTMYALGHASVVAVLGLAAFLFGLKLPDWIDPIMGSLVGLTLLALGAWLLWSAYRVMRHGSSMRLRSRWMLAFDGLRAVRSRIHGRTHDPAAAASQTQAYGAGTSYGVGMIHGIGAETATQILLITAIGGAAGQQLGIPLMLSFIVGLLVANTVIVGVSASGLGAARDRKRLQATIGVIAGLVSIFIGGLLFFGLDTVLPDIPTLLGA